MSDSDEQINQVIRAAAGRVEVAPRSGDELDEIDRHCRVVEMSESERSLYEQWRAGPEMKSDADVNAWFRRQAGRA